MFLCYPQKRGDTFLFPGLSADTTGGVPHLAGVAVARLCAAASARRSGILLAACGRSLPMQRHRTWSGAQPRVAYGVRSADLRNLPHSGFREEDFVSLPNELRKRHEVALQTRFDAFAWAKNGHTRRVESRIGVQTPPHIAEPLQHLPDEVRPQ